MELTDTRIYRALYVGNVEMKSGAAEGINSMLIKPYSSRYTYANDFVETKQAVYNSAIDQISYLPAGSDKEIEQITNFAETRVKEIDRIQQLFSNLYTASMSMIHPYALLRLTGTNEKGNFDSSQGEQLGSEGRETRVANLFDKSGRLRWYETDVRMTNQVYDNNPTDDDIDVSTASNYSFNYAKTPTTKDLINWSTYDEMGRFPYAFQDFVFCKYWNKIENNRLITLRRYPSPILDNVLPANYKNASKDVKVKKYGTPIYKEPFPPVATAVTYFGEGTDNSIKDLLNFTVGYKWTEINSDIHKTTSNQIEEGKIFNDAGGYLNTGLGAIAIMLGLMGDYTGKAPITQAQIAGLPPDPYENGPYENRIIGPVNVIKNVYKREQGLTFQHDSLTLTFDYMARPIAHVNNKAILLDLLANILTMTYSSGLWFGGAHKYRNEHPAVYPWRDMNSLNKIYQGKLFGKDGAYESIFNSFFNEGTLNFAMDLAGDIISGIKEFAGQIVDAITGGGEDAKAEKERKEKENASYKKTTIFSRLAGTAGRAISAHLLRNQQIPWLQGARALLTGEPVGDWHLTIGNPLNPIAMIGNLIVDNCTVEFYDELGPDDFPIGFKAKITLKHGMGRDKDTVESMFNRGNGRIYILSDAFKTSADNETTVDDYTGVKNSLRGKVAVGNWGALQTTGSFGITKAKLNELSINTEEKSTENFVKYNPDRINAINADGIYVTNLFKTTPWAMHYIL